MKSAKQIAAKREYLTIKADTSLLDRSCAIIGCSREELATVLIENQVGQIVDEGNEEGSISESWRDAVRELRASEPPPTAKGRSRTRPAEERIQQVFIPLVELQSLLERERKRACEDGESSASGIGVVKRELERIIGVLDPTYTSLESIR